jgi:mRNA interferase MazF
MVINQGDIFWVDTDTPIGSAPGYRRPYVVVQNNYYNHSRLNTVVVCGLTTNLMRASALGNVLLHAGDGGLLKDSVVVVAHILTIDKRQIDEYIGTLSAYRIRQILDGVHLLTEPREA